MHGWGTPFHSFHLTQINLQNSCHFLYMYKQQWNTRWAFVRGHMFICENNTLSSHVKDHHCYGYKINRAFHNKKLLKWNALVFHWCFIISRTLHGFLEIQDFCSRVEEILHSFAVLTREIFFNTQREISYFREAMYYPLCLYIFFLY